MSESLCLSDKEKSIAGIRRVGGKERDVDVDCDDIPSYYKKRLRLLEGASSLRMLRNNQGPM